MRLDRPISACARAIARPLLAVLVMVPALGVGEASGGQLTATWVDNSSGQAAFRVQRRTGTESTFAQVAEVPAGSTGVIDQSVSDGVTYCYRVQAFTSTAVSPYSAEACGASAPPTGYSITVTKAGTGTGTVTSNPTGISCGSDCTQTYISGTLVTLSATADAGSKFDGWSGSGCAGTQPCTVSANVPVAVTATFSPQTVLAYSLDVTKKGPGSVVSSPAGINCGSDCNETYRSDTLVTLTANPLNGATFMGWGGGYCSGVSPTCTVTIKAATSVVAGFKKYGKSAQQQLQP